MTSTSWGSCFAQDDRAYFYGTGSLRPTGLKAPFPQRPVQSTAVGHLAAPCATNRVHECGESKLDAQDLACPLLQTSPVGITDSPGLEVRFGSPPEQRRSHPGPRRGSENHTLRRRWR